MVFVAMVELAPGSSGSSHGIPIDNVAYRVYFVTRTTWLCFCPSRLVGRVEVLAYNDRIISFRE